MLLIALGCFVGYLFCPYFAHRQIIRFLWREHAFDTPAGLFVLSNLSAVLSFVLAYGAAYIMGTIGLLLIFLLIGVGGLIGWVVLFLRYVGGRQVFITAFERCSVTKYQVWLQDIAICVTMYGIAMTLIFNNAYREPIAMAMLALMEFLNHFLAFFITLEFFRVCSFAASPRKRALGLMLGILLCEVPFYVFLYFIAWIGCRNALVERECSKSLTP